MLTGNGGHVHVLLRGRHPDDLQRRRVFVHADGLAHGLLGHAADWLRRGECFYIRFMCARPYTCVGSGYVSFGSSNMSFNDTDCHHLVGVRHSANLRESGGDGHATEPRSAPLLVAGVGRSVARRLCGQYAFVLC